MRTLIPAKAYARPGRGVSRSPDESGWIVQFGVIPPVRTGVTADPAWMRRFARHAEECGFESVVVGEPAVVVSGYQSVYPYAPSGKMPLPDSCAIPDPLDLLAFVAACTSRIVLATGVLVLPNHHPVVLAKRVATVDVLSGGRMRLCVGVGWMDEELRATGADPRTRGRRSDEAIRAMRTLWADAGEDGASFDGEFFSFRHAHSFPKPTRPAGVPVHIGGHTRAAARRAGRLGDGFQPLGLGHEQVRSLVLDMRESAEQAGRDPDGIELTLSGYLPTTDDTVVGEAEALGADRLVLSTSITDDLEVISDEMTAFAERRGLGGRLPGRLPEDGVAGGLDAPAEGLRG